LALVPESFPRSHATLTLHADRLTVEICGEAVEHLTDRVATFAERAGAAVRRLEPGAVEITSPAAEHLRTRISAELGKLAVVAIGWDAPEWAVVILDARGGRYGFTIRATTAAGIFEVEELRRSLDEQTLARSGGSDGVLVLGCRVGEKARAIEQVLAWLAERGVAVRRVG
jgi:hypothetical protein